MPVGTQDPGKGLAIASVVLWFLGLSLFGLICAIISRRKTRNAGLPRNAVATIGLVINIIGLVIGAIIVLILVLTTYTGVQHQARNTKRDTDIQSIQTQLEAFDAQKGYYPSLSDLNSPSWRSKNMSGLDQNALSDPSDPSQSQQLAARPKANQYSYEVTDKNGSSCENDDTKCSNYTLTATYEGTVDARTTFSKSNLTSPNTQ